jgi:hypothetical protein
MTQFKNNVLYSGPRNQTANSSKVLYLFFKDTPRIYVKLRGPE